MFPKELDDADVLFHTPKGNFGTLYYTTGEVFDDAKYLAICRYPDFPNQYYLFQVNEHYEVISDYPCGSIEECMKNAVSFYDRDVRWIRGGIDMDVQKCRRLYLSSKTKH